MRLHRDPACTTNFAQSPGGASRSFAPKTMRLTPGVLPYAGRPAGRISVLLGSNHREVLSWRFSV